MKTLVKVKIVVEDEGRALTVYFWKRRFLCFGYWYPFGCSSSNVVPKEKLDKINDDAISKLIYENVLSPRSSSANP
jgi:hypothetical protein